MGLALACGGLLLTAGLAFCREGAAHGSAEAVMEMSLPPGGTASGKVAVENSGDEAAAYEMATRAFRPAGSGGSIEFAEASEEEMLGWVEFAQTGFTVEPGEAREVSFLVNAPEGAEPGGHYAVITAFPAAGSPDGQEGEQLLGMLLVNVTGGLEYEGEITGFRADKESYEPGETVSFLVRFKNEGNVHVKPSGRVDVFKGNTKVGEAPVNGDGGLVFPGAARDFRAGWQGANFGKYTARAELSFGGTEEASAGPVSFWVVNWTTIIIVLAVVLASVFLIILLTRKKKNKSA